MDNKPLLDFLDSLVTVPQLEKTNAIIENGLKDLYAQIEELKRENAEQKEILRSYVRIIQEQTAMIASLNQSLNDRIDALSKAAPNDTKEPEKPKEEQPKKIEKNEKEEVQENLESLENLEPLENLESLEPLENLEPLEKEKKEEKPQTLADSIHAEESLADKLSKSVEHETLANTINSKHIETIQSAITIADRFRFQRELFSGDGAMMSSTIDDLNALSSMAEAEDYLKGRFNWNYDSQAVADFLAIVNRRFS